MVENLKKSVEILKQKVRSNLDLLHQNERKIKEILKEPVSRNRSEKLNKRFSTNKKILQENNDAILLQRSILLFIENYYSEISNLSNVLNTNTHTESKLNRDTKIDEIKKEDYLDLTINGAMEFDKRHPFFYDKDFFNDLLSYYSKIEDYETCSKLTKLTSEKISLNNDDVL